MISEPGSSLRKRDVQDRRLSIIDVSSADDSLLDANPLNHLPLPLENQEHSGLLYTPNSKKFEDAATKLEEWEREPRSNETSEIEKPKKNSKCNLRKSLAWDSAFFTSAGVLDPEELSSIIEGVEKEEKHALPGIQEDVYKSCDSLSTLGSESLTLEVESLEGDLFEDVRASIQKSSNKKASFAIGNGEVLSGVGGFQTDESSKMVGVASRYKMKAPPASKIPSSGMQGLGKMTKKNPIFPQIPQKPVATRRESSILKQSKLPGKPSPSSTLSSKRVSLSNPHIKSEAKRIIGDRVSSVPKASVVGASRGAVPKFTLSSRSPSGPSVSTKTKSATSKSAGTLKPPSRSVVRTPSKVVSTNKTEAGNSGLSGLMSVTKLSSSVSPASSVSDWSSESSSSASMAKHLCNSSRTSLESSSGRKILSDTDAEQVSSSQNPVSDSSFEGLEIQHVGFINSGSTTAPGGTILPPAPVKPSGLRLPSPKIGFFDGVKSSRTPRGGMQPHSVVPRGLPKHGAQSPTEGGNKAKLGKLQAARSILPVENTKPTNQQNSLPTPLHESLDIATKTSSGLQNVKSSSDIPKEVQKEMHLKTGTGNLKANNTVAEEHFVGTHDNGVTLNNGDHICVSGTVENVENTSPFHVVDKAPRPCQLVLVNDLHTLECINHKENVHYDDQVDCLSKRVGLMDISLETREKKFNGDNLSFSQNDTSFQDKSSGLELSGQKEFSDYLKKEELLKGSPTLLLSVSPTSFDMAASTRRPFAVKDAFCNMDDSVFTDSAVSEVKPTNLPVPDSIRKENS